MAQYSRGFNPAEVIEQKGIRNIQAADYVGYRPVKGGYIADIIEITTEDKKKSELGKQFEGAKRLVVDEFNEVPVKYEYFLITNNGRLVDKFEQNNHVVISGDKKIVNVMDER